MKTNVRNYRDLIVWQKGVDLVVESYRLAGLLPKNEEFGLKSQIRRACVSVPANIAEGHGRDHLGDYLHHLSIANGSLMELETHLLICVRLGHLEEDLIASALQQTAQVARMLSGLSAKLRARRSQPPLPNT